METLIKTTKLTGLILLLSIIFFIGSCGVGSKSPASNYAENGIGLSKNAAQLFKDFNSEINMQAYQEELVKILNDPSPDTYLIKSSADTDITGMEYLYIANALNSLEKVFIAYQLILDPSFKINESMLREKMLMACNSLDSLNLNETLKKKNTNIKKTISAGKFRIEGSLFLLTDIYAEFWHEISQNYLAGLIEFQKKFESGIKSIPVSAFNIEKVKSIVDEPYSSNAVLVNLYKLKLIKESQDQIARLDRRNAGIVESFNLLIQIQGELMRRNTDKLKIAELNNALELLLTYE